MKYIVSMKIDARLPVEVDAENPEEARKNAIAAFMEADLKDIEFVDADPVNCEDEEGNLTDYY